MGTPKYLRGALLAERLENSTQDEEVVHIMIKAYKKSKNSEFRTYAEHVSTQIDEGAVIKLPALLAKIEAKYDKLIEENKKNKKSYRVYRYVYVH